MWTVDSMLLTEIEEKNIVFYPIIITMTYPSHHF